MSRWHNQHELPCRANNIAASSASPLSLPSAHFIQGSDEQKEAAALALVAVLEAVRIVAVLLTPVTPALSGRIHAALGYSPEEYGALRWADAAWGGLRAGQATPPPAPVFQRLEGKLVMEPAGSKTSAVAA